MFHVPGFIDGPIRDEILHKVTIQNVGQLVCDYLSYMFGIILIIFAMKGRMTSVNMLHN